MQIRSITMILAAAAFLTAASAVTYAATVDTLRQGPEAVFDQPLGSIFADLQEAKRTQESGRVGREFVYWGFTLAAGQPVLFYACAITRGVDCGRRSVSLCHKPANVLKTSQTIGRVRHLECRLTCTTDLGSQNCCSETEAPGPVEAGLVSCGG